MEAIVMERIRELWRYRQWWRTNRWADWPQVRHDLELELRALVRLARQARRERYEMLVADLAEIDRLYPEQRDPITQALAYHDWQIAGPR